MKSWLFLNLENMNILKTHQIKVLQYIKLFSWFSILAFSFSCNDKECVYQKTYPGCNLNVELNLSTGTDATGTPIPAAFGAVDPFWKIINQPPLYQNNISTPCTNSSIGTFTGETYVMNFGSGGADSWVNQTGSSTIAPFDLGPNGSFNCNNASNSNGDTVPFVFERSFCVLEDTNIDFSFTFKGDDRVNFVLIKNDPYTIMSSSTTYVWSPPTGIQTWTETGLPLSAGSYSIRGKLVNTGSVILGFSFLGNMTTSDGIAAISNNANGCCENNVISILNILEEDCDRTYNNSSDTLGNNWTFNLLDSNNTIVRTEITDINGNIFFSGLPDGTYTVQIVNQTGWTQSTPSQTVTISNNSVQILEFFSCIE